MIIFQYQASRIENGKMVTYKMMKEETASKFAIYQQLEKEGKISKLEVIEL